MKQKLKKLSIISKGSFFFIFSIFLNGCFSNPFHTMLNVLHPQIQKKTTLSKKQTKKPFVVSLKKSRFQKRSFKRAALKARLKSQLRKRKRIAKLKKSKRFSRKTPRFSYQNTRTRRSTYAPSRLYPSPSSFAPPPFAPFFPRFPFTQRFAPPVKTLPPPTHTSTPVLRAFFQPHQPSWNSAQFHNNSSPLNNSFNPFLSNPPSSSNDSLPPFLPPPILPHPSFHGPQPSSLPPSTTSYSIFCQGTGTASNPYVICKSKNFVKIALYPHAFFELDTDVTFSKTVSFSQAVIAQFSGSLDGKGHVIKNLWIQSSQKNFVGLFGKLSQAHIQNLQIQDPKVTGNSFVGILAGKASESTLENITLSHGFVLGKNYIGGLLGTSFQTSLEKTTYQNTLTLKGENYLGGLSGVFQNSQSSFFQAKTISIQSSGSQVGGLVGVLDGISTLFENAIIDSLTVSGKTPIGAAFGSMQNQAQASILEITGTLTNTSPTPPTQTQNQLLVGNYSQVQDKLISDLKNSTFHDLSSAP